MQMPPFLEDGDTIAAIAPSRWVPEGVLENARNILAGLGLNLVWDASINEQSGQFAGEDRHRASSMMKAWSNVEVKALWAARGGYGAQRILETLDSKAMQDAPKWFIGFSDSTAIHAHLNQLGILSIHAPVLSTVPLVPVEDVDACASILQGGIWKGLECAPLPLNRAGNAKGRLIGGNLTILQTLIGTSDFPVQSGDILIIEEVDEMLYHLDRMLLHLDRAGVLSSIAGLCVGDMTDMRDNTKAYGFSSDNPYGLSAEEIIAERLKAYAIPVGFGLPCGHGVRNHPLLLGAPVEMTVGANGTELRHV